MYDRIASDPVTTKYGLPAEEVPQKELHKYLCSAAVDYNGTEHPEICESCEVGCAYGRRLVQLRKEKTA